jgi:hypothetical protein
MWVFLIPVILLAGATFAGSAVQMSSKPSPQNPSAQSAAAQKQLPVNGPLPFDPPSRQR